MRRPLVTCLIALGLVGACVPAGAHIFGYHAVDSDVIVMIAPDSIRVRMIVFLGEVPSAALLASADTDDDKQLSNEEGKALAADYQKGVRDDLRLTLNGQRATLEFVNGSAVLVWGMTPMPQIQVVLQFNAVGPRPRVGTNTLHVHNLCDINRLGTRDLVFTVQAPEYIEVVGQPEKIDCRKAEDYQAMAGMIPPDYREGTVTFEMDAAALEVIPSEHAVDEEPRGVDVARSPGTTKQSSRLVNMIGELAHRHTIGVLIVSLGIAFVLGMLHAAQPGHGKTLVAAYLVGSHGKVRHAVLLGLIVTLTHTFSVYIIAVLVLVGVKGADDITLIFWLKLVSGLGIAAIGAWLLASAVRRKALPHVHLGGGHHHGHEHDHDDAHDHGHGHDHAHPHDHTHAHHHPHSHDGAHTHDNAGGQVVAPPSLKRLLALGITGGLVPCPDGILLILAAAYLQVVAFGIMLLVSFSLGLATTLVTIGILVVRGSKLITGRLKKPARVFRWASIASATIITLIGCGMAYAAVRFLAAR